MNPQSSTSNTKHIESLISKKDFELAEKLLKQKVSTNESDDNAYHLLGVIYYLKGNLGTAVSSLKKCLSINPKHTEAAICLSVLYNDIGKYNQAKNIFDKANQSVLHFQSQKTHHNIDKKFSVKHLEIGDLYFRYRRFDEALEEYNKSLLLDPKNLGLKIKRVKTISQKGLVHKAIDELLHLKQEAPSYIPARVQLGLLYYKQGDLLDAELEWESAKKLNPENKELDSYLAMVQKSRLDC